MPKKIILYHIESSIKNLGPGSRYAIWLQGCKFACKGCLVEDSWKLENGQCKNISDLYNDIVNTKDIEGITFSGGEPFEQVDALYDIIQKIKFFKTELSIMIFTGYTLKELIEKNSLKILYVIQNIDILVDGKYIQELYEPDPWRGSKNQNIHFLTQRYSVADYIKAYKNYRFEYYIKDGGGKYFASGIPIKKDKK